MGQHGAAWGCMGLLRRSPLLLCKRCDGNRVTTQRSAVHSVKARKKTLIPSVRSGGHWSPSTSVWRLPFRTVHPACCC
jgi:hypothetical protein